MRARIVTSLVVVAGMAAFALVVGLLQPQASEASREDSVCVSVGVPDTSTLSSASAEELKRTEAEIGKPILRLTIGEHNCFASDAEAQDFLNSRNAVDGTQQEPTSLMGPL